jgi:hypothetical protein
VLALLGHRASAGQGLGVCASATPCVRAHGSFQGEWSSRNATKRASRPPPGWCPLGADGWRRTTQQTPRYAAVVILRVVAAGIGW